MSQGGEFHFVQMQFNPRHSSSSRRLPRPTVGGTARRVVTRTCIGCKKPGDARDLVRMVLGPEGGIAFDLAGGAVGRGAWVHPVDVCLSRAAKSTRRSLRGDGSVDVAELTLLLANAARRRASGLLGAAKRARHVAIGSDACQEAWEAGTARLVVLATDARAAARMPAIDEAVAKGKVVAWATKQELGAIVGREELAVLAVTEQGLAEHLLRVVAMTIPAMSRMASNTVKAMTAASERTTGSQGRQDSEDG